MPNYVPLEDFRARIESIPGGVEVSIPSRRNYAAAAFIAFWLCGWVFGLVTAGGQLLSPPHVGKDPPPELFLFVWLGLWIIGGLSAMTFLLWNLAGRERVTVRTDALSIRREVFGLGRGRHYELSAVKDLRAVESAVGTILGSFGRRDPFGVSSGPLAFDYGAKTVRFGAGIDMAEAKHILSKLIAAKPSLAPKD
jgi:hypothetical protein